MLNHEIIVFFIKNWNVIARSPRILSDFFCQKNGCFLDGARQTARAHFPNFFQWIEQQYLGLKV